MRLEEKDSDGTRWTLRAAGGSGWETEGTGKLKDVRAVFERGGKKIEMTSHVGEISEAKTISLSGGVEVSWNGCAARMDRATYYRGKGEVKSDAPVELIGPNFRVLGTGLEMDIEGRATRVLSDVKTVVGGPKK